MGPRWQKGGLSLGKLCECICGTGNCYLSVCLSALVMWYISWPGLGAKNSSTVCMGALDPRESSSVTLTHSHIYSAMTHSHRRPHSHTDQSSIAGRPARSGGLQHALPCPAAHAATGWHPLLSLCPHGAVLMSQRAYLLSGLPTPKPYSHGIEMVELS